MRPLPLVALLVLVLSLSAAPAAVQPATSRLTGRVLDADSGKPLQDVRVRTYEITTRLQREAATDREGRYTFDGVSPGRYVISASAPGYANGRVLRDNGVQHPPHVMRVGTGQTVNGLDVRLTRGASVSGVITDPSGLPLAGVDVVVEGGFAAAGPFPARAVTNQHGSYRIDGVPIGQRFVAVRYRGPNPRRPQRTMFVFYPGTTMRRDAVVVMLGAGDHAANVNIIVPAVATHGVGGLLGAGSTSSDNVTVRLLANHGRSIRSVRPRPDGTFTMPDVDEGRHLLWVEDRGNGHAAWLAVDVFHDVDLPPVELLPLGRITGRIVTPAGSLVPAGLRIEMGLLAHGDEFELIGERATAVSPDGSFDIPDVLGPRRLLVRGLPNGWTVRGMRRDKASYAQADVDVPPGQPVERIELLLDRP